MAEQLNILLIEDSDTDADLLTRFLKKQGIEFSYSRVWQKDTFIDALKGNNYDIIIADHSLPQFSGMEAFRIVKTHKKNIPFILVTGTVPENILAEYAKEGIDDYILKENLLRLPSAIEHVISKKKIELLHKKLEVAHTDIKDSINYAKLIQQAVLPAQEHLNTVLNDHFIFFKPRDIVSGDFYWTTIFKNYLIFAVADCTGHGVPGAFMSMLGSAFLNEIVSKNQIYDPAIILNMLRKNIITSLHQKGFSEEQKDGMDISLVMIDLIPDPIWIENGVCKEVLKLTYAGANNPIWIIRDKNSHLKNNDKNSTILRKYSTEKADLFEILPDKMPVGIYFKMDDFTNKEFYITKGDIIYLFSDGYADQFGGSNNKKFKYSQMRELLISICDKSMNEQREILKNTFVDWMGKYKQTDDVIVMGVKI